MTNKTLVILGDQDVLTRQAIEAACLCGYEPVLITSDAFDNHEDWPVEVRTPSDPQPDGPIFVAWSDQARRLARIRTIPTELAPNLMHPSAYISRSAQFGRNVLVGPQCVVGPAARLGDGVAQNALGSIEHDNQIADGVFLGTGVILCGNVTIGELAFIGGGATVQPGRSIGARATVGTGAVVVKNVDPGATVVGNPARALPTSTN